MIAHENLDEKAIFNIARKVPPDARAEYLQQVCGTDRALFERVNTLLNAYQVQESFLESPPVEAVPLTLDQQPERLGTHIGPYKLLEQIGEGGFGVVYMAEQTEPVRRKVALKVLKPGMDTRQVIARFEAERQALAIMDHPNIARVFDGGATPTGRPFFVMELVRGVPITDYCDQNRLTTRERLALFITVCHSVQHAHQKGLIHRDLKPSNVLVSRHDTTPIVKIIDFGVAKALGQSLTDKTLFTGIAQMIGTPMYMSPEQAGMSDLDIDTRSDIYSLGVLLYELLTGTTPFDKNRLKTVTFDELRRIIREEEPETVSARIARTRRVGSAHQTPLTLGEGGRKPGEGAPTPHSALRTPHLPELDWIVMKSLEKDRSRRYESASALAADIQRYLSDEPVLACPPTTMYRLQKFTRKHKPALATAAAIALCLLLGTTVSAWQAVRATTAEAEANANATEAQEKAKEATEQRDEVKAIADKLAAKEQQLQRTLYAAHMNLAHNAFEAGTPARLRELLAQHRPQPGELDLRGFEWHYLNRLGQPDLLTLKGANAVAYSPDGQRLATASNTLKLWDSQTGKELISVNGGDRGLFSAAFSPDGKRVASSGTLGTVKIWDTQSGRELLSFQPRGGGMQSVAFSLDGKRLAGTSVRGPVRIWDAQTGEELLNLPGHEVNSRSVAFSPDGKRLASGAQDKTVKLWDAETGQELRTLLGHADSVCSVAFSPDGKHVASASQDKTVKLWDAESGNEIRTLLGHTGQVWSVTFSPDGKRLASASSDTTVKVWDAETGEELFELRGHASVVRCVVFSPDGKHLASASGDGTVKVREAKPVQKAQVLGSGATPATQVAFSPDGKRLAGAYLRDARRFEVKVWDTQSGEQLRTVDTGDNSISFNESISLNGFRLAGGSAKLAGREIAIEANTWDLLTGERLLKIPFNVENSEAFFPINYNYALSPDGTRLVGTIGGEMKIWDAKTGQEIHKFKVSPRSVVSKVFSPDGKRLAGIAGRTLKLWSAQTGDELLNIDGVARSLAFSSDGKRLVSGSDDATVAKVWDAQTGDELQSLKGHSGVINSVVFSPDNKRLATTSSDATIKVWDSQTGQELLTLAGHSGRDNGVAFSPEGNRLAAGGPNGTVLIYDATPLPEKP